MSQVRGQTSARHSPVETSWSCCSCRACSFSKSSSDTTGAVLLPVPPAAEATRPAGRPSSRRCSRCRCNCCPNCCPSRPPRWTSCLRPLTCHYWSCRLCEHEKRVTAFRYVPRRRACATTNTTASPSVVHTAATGPHTYLDALAAASDEITLVDVELRRLLSVCGDSVSCCESCGPDGKRIRRVISVNAVSRRRDATRARAHALDGVACVHAERTTGREKTTTYLHQRLLRLRHYVGPSDGRFNHIPVNEKVNENISSAEVLSEKPKSPHAVGPGAGDGKQFRTRGLNLYEFNWTKNKFELLTLR